MKLVDQKWFSYRIAPVALCLCAIAAKLKQKSSYICAEALRESFQWIQGVLLGDGHPWAAVRVCFCKNSSQQEQDSQV